MMKSRRKLSGRFYLVSVVLIVLALALAGCDSGTVGDIDSDNGIVADGDLDGAKLFAQNLSDHSINLMELGTAQAENLEEGMLEQVGPYAEATFNRMVWVSEIMDMWDAKMDEPGVYEVNFQEDRDNYDELILKSNSIVDTWIFEITNFYDDPIGDENIKHVVTIESYPESYHKKQLDDEDGYAVYEINLADVKFKYTHERYDNDVKDEDFDWSLDFSLNGEESEPVLIYEYDFVNERYYYILPINPNYNLLGTLEDDLLIDNNSGDVQVGELNNDDVTPPNLGSITVNSNLVTDSVNKEMTVDGNITATYEGRQTVEFDGETIVKYNDYIFENENVVIDLIDFNSGSTFKVNDYFEITGGLEIQFSELKMQPESYFSLSVPDRIVLEGSYEDLSEVNGMNLNGDITVEFVNINDYDFEAVDSEDNFAQVKVSINGDLSSKFDPIGLGMVIERTGLEEITIDQLNYSFADGSSMEGEGIFSPNRIEFTGRCDSSVWMYLDITLNEFNSEDYLLGEVRDGNNDIVADITFDAHEMVFEFIDGESIAMFPADNDQQ